MPDDMKMPEPNSPFLAYFAATQTITASRWTMFLARLFGVKRVTEDSGCTITMHYWRGKYYLTGCVNRSGT